MLTPKCESDPVTTNDTPDDSNLVLLFQSLVPALRDHCYVLDIRVRYLSGFAKGTAV